MAHPFDYGQVTFSKQACLLSFGGRDSPPNLIKLASQWVRRPGLRWRVARVGVTSPLHQQPRFGADALFHGFFQSVKDISSSRISCNLCSRRSWSAAPGILLPPCKYKRFASLICAISSRNLPMRSLTGCCIGIG